MNSFQYNLHTVDWTAVSAIISGAALILNAVLVLSIVVSLRALRESRHTKEYNILIWTLENMRATRATMVEIINNRNNNDWLYNNRVDVLKTIGTLQMVSYFAMERIIPMERVADMWGKSIVEQWICLESFIQSFRSEIGEPSRAEDGAYYARSFEKFASFSKDYLTKKFKTDWSYFSTKDDPEGSLEE